MSLQECLSGNLPELASVTSLGCEARLPSTSVTSEAACMMHNQVLFKMHSPFQAANSAQHKLELA